MHNHGSVHENKLDITHLFFWLIQRAIPSFTMSESFTFIIAPLFFLCSRFISNLVLSSLSLSRTEGPHYVREEEPCLAITTVL